MMKKLLLTVFTFSLLLGVTTKAATSTNNTVIQYLDSILNRLTAVQVNTGSANTTLASTLTGIEKQVSEINILRQLVPKMTANTTPNGTVTATQLYSNLTTPPYKMFDGDPNTVYVFSTTVADNWVKYEFADSGHVVKQLRLVTTITNSPNYGCRMYSFKFEGSNDNTNWDVLLNITNNTQVDRVYDVPNNKRYKYYRIHNMKTQYNGIGYWYYTQIHELEFIGY